MVLQEPSKRESDGYNNPVFADDCSPEIPTMLPRAELSNGRQKKEFKVSIVDPSPHMNNETKEYDPHDYCTSKKPTSYCDSMLHYLKAAIGTGILALPSAFKDSGYVVGVGGIIFVSIYYTICIHLLVSTEYELCRRKRVPNMSYAATVHAAFTEGPPRFRWLADIGKFFANFFFMVYESGGCAIYIIFIASNLKQLIDFYYQTDVDLRTLMAYIMLPVVLVCWVRNLKILVPLSAIANFITIASFILVFWYVFREPPTLENRQPTGEISKLPQYSTTILFAIACTGLILPLKSEMRKPKQFGIPMGVLNISMIPIALLYAVFGFFGYLKYGDSVKGSITLNLPEDELLAQGIKGLYSLSVFISYFLCYYVVFDIVWKNYLSSKVKNNKIIWEYVVRTLIPMVTFILAYAIPNLEAFISLVGALGISSTSLVIPIMIHTLVFWDSYKTSSDFILFATRNMILLILAMVIFVTGVYESAKTANIFQGMSDKSIQRCFRVPKDGTSNVV